MFTVHERQALLARVAPFDTLGAPVLAGLAAIATETSYEAGATIFMRGDPGNAIFVVTDGRVRLSVLTADGRELSFMHAVAGDMFGEIAAIDRQPRSAGATALTAVRVLILPSTDLERLVDHHPALAWALMRFLCARLRGVSDHLEDIALLPVEARLARFLLARCDRDLAADPKAQAHASMGMSQSELAMLLGASRQKVNAALSALEQSGAVARTPSGFRCDRPRLRQAGRVSDS